MPFMLADIEGRHDMRVAQASGNPGLGEQLVGICGNRVRQRLDRHFALEHGIGREIHDRLRTPAKHPDHLDAADPRRHRVASQQADGR